MFDALLESFLSIQVAEAATNYAYADEPLTQVPRDGEDARRGDSLYAENDQVLWRWILDPDRRSTKSIYLDLAAVTEWVARIPGLYWRPGSERMRKVHPAQIQAKAGNWTTYTPRGKSQLVVGGVGTLRFPPAEDGFRLVTVTLTHNASAGVPALVSPEVWEDCQLFEGSLVDLSGVLWRPMPQKWAAQFPVIRGIERGCLLLTEVATVKVREQGAPVQAHPFSIMEYWDGNTQLHDFVYATGNTNEEGFRCDLSKFFEEYRKDNDRQGTYLTTSDIANPMWDATFADPGEMRASKGAALRLIEKRAEEAANGQDNIEALLRRLSTVERSTDLRRLSEKAGIPFGRWSTSGISLAEEAARLVDAAVLTNKQQALLHAVILELP